MVPEIVSGLTVSDFHGAAMKNVQIIEHADNAAIADWLHECLITALAADPGPVAITVPGGSTPFPVMEQLAQRDLDWARIVIWPSDDRVVPAAHDASNEGRIRAIFEPVGGEVAALTIMEQVPGFALTWLGMGADGHIASLFSNADPRVDATEPIVRVTPDPLPPEAPFDRISLTMPSLLSSRQILFTFGGNSDKRAVFDDALAGHNDLPIARFLCAASQKVTCFA